MTKHIIDYFEALTDHGPDEECLVFVSQHMPTQRFTFGQLDERANRAAAVLADLGIKKGDHVGCHLYDTPAHIDALMGAWKLGAVPINVNFRYVTHELLYLFEDAKLKLVMTEPELADIAKDAAKSLPNTQVLVCDDDYEKRLAAAPATRPKSERTPDDLYMIYTGGTTGMPKGVMWRMEDALHACFGIDAIEALQIPAVNTPEEAVAVAEERPPAVEALRTACPFLPLMHAGGQWAIGRMLTRGSRVVLIRDVHFDPKFALQVLKDEEAGVAWSAGDAHARPVLDALNEHHHGVLDLPKLILWVNTAVMITPSIKAALEKALPGTFVFDALGASETGGQGQAVGYSDEGAPRFMMEDDTIILDEGFKPIPKSERKVGKLAKTGHIPLGYFNDDAKTQQTFPVIDGVRYVVPGDLACWEDDGSLKLMGRGSVSINSGGEKIFPEEVEKALKTHPAVFDAVVVGTKDPRFGKKVTAVVQLREGQADPGLEALAEHCKQTLAGYKVPRALVIKDKIVRSPAGKPDYRWAEETAKAALEAS